MLDNAALSESTCLITLSILQSWSSELTFGCSMTAMVLEHTRLVSPFLFEPEFYLGNDDSAFSLSSTR